jgi:hypothetical protein
MAVAPRTEVRVSDESEVTTGIDCTFAIVGDEVRVSDESEVTTGID